ncbi:MAG: DUF1840 domain-containing protein [Betaproteobacteria bacterium]
MLVRFTSITAGEMIMFAQHVRSLFEIIGKECTARGVFTKEQLPEAIARLRGAVDEEKLDAKLARMPHDDDEEEQAKPAMDHDTYEMIAKDKVGLVRRAYPLIHFMELTEKENGFVLWETDEDF